MEWFQERRGFRVLAGLYRVLIKQMVNLQRSIKYGFNGRILYGVRYCIFIAFYFLSLRLILLYLYDSSPILSISTSAIVIVIGFLTIWNVTWSLYIFIFCVPIVSGLQMIGFLSSGPILSIGFASIFLSWLPKFLLQKREIIKSKTGIENLVDFLSGIILLSLAMLLYHYPPNIWLFSRNVQNNLLSQSFNGAYLLLQGLFFYRVIVLEADDDQKFLNRIILIFYLQALVIIFFSLLQLIFHIPAQKSSIISIYSPFDDIHSYGSYITFIFFVFLNFVSGKYRLLNILFVLIFFIMIILSFSRATWLATFVIFLFYILIRLSMKMKMLFICLTIACLLTINLFPNTFLQSKSPYVKRLGRLVLINNYLKDKTILGRLVRWKTSLRIIQDYPITGSGIGTFFELFPAYLDPEDKTWMHKLRKRWKAKENAHNYYLQICADLGIPALIVFIGIIFYSFKAGLRTVKAKMGNKRIINGTLYGLSAYLITMITGHPLLLSNQQYLFWSIIAVVTISYNYYIKDSMFHWWELHSKLLLGFLSVVIIGGYVSNVFISHAFSFEHEYGVYAYENWKEKKFRWTMRESRFYEFAQSDIIYFELVAFPHNIDKKGLRYNIFVNDQLLEQAHILSPVVKKLYFYLPFIKGKKISIKTVVNKTFNPSRIGLSKDNRELGIAISEVIFLEEMPKDGVGFYKWESFKTGQILEWPMGVPTKYRWTGMRATLNLRNYSVGDLQTKDNIELDKIKEKGLKIFMRCAHPDILKDPVIVKILNKGVLIREVMFEDNKWKNILISSNTLKESKTLTFQVSRTWNPKIFGISDDKRDLGVAAAVLNVRKIP